MYAHFQRQEWLQIKRLYVRLKVLKLVWNVLQQSALWFSSLKPSPHFFKLHFLRGVESESFLNVLLCEIPSVLMLFLFWCFCYEWMTTMYEWNFIDSLHYNIQLKKYSTLNSLDYSTRVICDSSWENNESNNISYNNCILFLLE